MADETKEIEVKICCGKPMLVDPHIERRMNEFDGHIYQCSECGMYIKVGRNKSKGTPLERAMAKVAELQRILEIA